MNVSKRKTIRLCDVKELRAAKTKGFDLDVDGRPVGLLLVHHGGQIYAYRNRCPHVSTPLNWVPDQFLDSEGEFLQCATHGAMFRIEDGYCEYGPCAGESLRPVPVTIRDGAVYWSEP